MKLHLCPDFPDRRLKAVCPKCGQTRGEHAGHLPRAVVREWMKPPRRGQSGALSLAAMESMWGSLADPPAPRRKHAR